jgi:RNA recognition motif-containing protein
MNTFCNADAYVPRSARQNIEAAAKFTTNTVYVEGIPYEATESDLVNFFKKCGGINGVRLPRYLTNFRPCV